MPLQLRVSVSELDIFHFNAGTAWLSKPEFSNLDFLIRSIHKVGQLQAIVTGPKLAKTGKYPVVAGVKRTLALGLLGFDAAISVNETYQTAEDAANHRQHESVARQELGTDDAYKNVSAVLRSNLIELKAAEVRLDGLTEVISGRVCYDDFQKMLQAQGMVSGSRRGIERLIEILAGESK